MMGKKKKKKEEKKRFSYHKEKTKVKKIKTE